MGPWEYVVDCYKIVKTSSTKREQFFEILATELSKRDGDVTKTTTTAESRIQHHYERIVSLTYWIVRRYIEGHGDEDRVKEWMNNWQEHIKELHK
ncbi:unnamed protein product [Adineta ricciae]|uniref:Uncharacterized protein n=1 Tax=Adineta ricciae TaxID=249248 RepID=A0A815HI36_ADIRI|nr:unnamed protein product [Adineta ricciae]CAF1531976.1 unnamed protein product [Adineta ricciae]